MRSLLSSLLVLILGVCTLWIGTDGFHAFTAESARRLAVLENPRTLPDVTLRDQDGKNFTLQDYKGKLVLLTFMYTRCGDACPILEKNFQQVYEGISPKLRGKDVQLISISFDRVHDTPQMLKHYASYFHADGVSWRMAGAVNEKELKELLKAFGVVVIPNGSGGFEHNTAFYLIQRNGTLTQIYDYDQPQKLLQQIKPML